MLGLVTGLPKSLLRATANASGAALGAAAASLSKSVLNKGDDWHVETVLVDPQTLGPHRNLETALQAAQRSVATLQLEKGNALINVKYFLALYQEVEEVNGALGTFNPSAGLQLKGDLEHSRRTLRRVSRDLEAAHEEVASLQLQLRSLTATNSTQAARVELLIEQLQFAQQQQQESSKLLAESAASISSQAARISELEQKDRVGTRVLTGLKVASAGNAADIELLRAQLQAAQLQLQDQQHLECRVTGLQDQLQAANKTSKRQQQQDQQQLEELISLLEYQDGSNDRVLADLMANCADKEAYIKLLTTRRQTAQLQLQETEQTVAGLQQQLQAANEVSQQQQQESQRRVANLEARLHATCESAKVPLEQLAVLGCSHARLADQVAQLQEQLCKDSEAATRKACDLELQVQAAKKAEGEARQQLQQAAVAATKLTATNACLAAKVESLERSQHTRLQEQQAATQQVQQLRGRLAALEGKRVEAHELQRQLAALEGEKREAQGLAAKQLEDAEGTIKRLTQEVHQGQNKASKASEEAKTRAAGACTEMGELRKKIQALEQEVQEAKRQAADAQARAQVAEAAAAKREQEAANAPHVQGSPPTVRTDSDDSTRLVPAVSAIPAAAQTAAEAPSKRPSVEVVTSQPSESRAERASLDCQDNLRAAARCQPNDNAKGSLEGLYGTVVSGSDFTQTSTNNFYPDSKAQFGSQPEASGSGSNSPCIAVTAGRASALVEAPAPGGSLSAQQASAEAPGPGAAGSDAAAPTANQKRSGTSADRLPARSLAKAKTEASREAAHPAKLFAVKPRPEATAAKPSGPLLPQPSTPTLAEEGRAQAPLQEEHPVAQSSSQAASSAAGAGKRGKKARHAREAAKVSAASAASQSVASSVPSSSVEPSAVAKRGKKASNVPTGLPEGVISASTSQQADAAKKLDELNNSREGEWLAQQGITPITWLGGGGCAQVYKCTRAGSSDPIAVKLYKRASGSVSNVEVAEHEITTYRSLGTVEGVARMVDSRLDEAAGMACMVQELAEGHTLASYKYDDETAGPWLGSRVLTKTLGKSGKGPKMKEIVIDTAVTIALQLAQLLCRFHERRFIWGDAKLANVLVDGRGLTAKITAVDVGSGRFLNAPEAAEGSIAIGTLEYSAPEVLEDNAEVNWERAEVWTLGVVLLELVSPVWCDMMDNVSTDPKTGRLLPKSLQPVCNKWMRSDAGSKLTTWRVKAAKACPTREAVIHRLVELLRDCFTFPEKRPEMGRVAERLEKIFV